MIHEATWPYRRLSEDLSACIDCYIVKHDRTESWDRVLLHIVARDY